MTLPSWLLPVSRERSDIPTATGIEVKCPKCSHRRMNEIFSRSVSRSSDDRIGYECPTCHYQVFSSPKAPESKVTILFDSPTHGRFEGPAKKIEPDETRSADKLTVWQKISKSRGPSKPTKYFCVTCNKERLTVGRKCPVCHNEIATD